MIASIRNYVAYLFVALLPWQTAWIVREVFVDGEKVHYSTLLLPVSLVVLIVLVVLSGSLLVAWWRFYSHKKITAIFLLVLILSIVFAQDQVGALYHAAVIGIGFLGAVILLRMELSWQRVIAVFVLSMCGHAFLALYQFITQSSFASTWLGMALHDAAVGGVSVVESSSGRWLRGYGGFTHPNILGGVIAAVCVLSMSMYLFYAHHRAVAIFYLVSAVLCAAALATSFSRSGIIALAVGIGILGVFAEGIKFFSVRRLLFIGGACGLMMSIIFYFYSDLLRTRIDPTRRLEARSIDERTQYIAESVTLLRDKPLLGVGVKNYVDAVRSKEGDTRPIWGYQPVHSVPLLIAVEIGFLGIVAISAALLVFVRYLCVSVKSRKEMVFAAPLVAIVVQSLFDHWQWSSVFGLLLTFFLGVILLMGVKASDSA